MKILSATVLALALFAIADIVLPIEHHLGAFWQNIPGGYALMGFIGCLILIIVAKAVAGVGIQQEGEDD